MAIHSVQQYGRAESIVKRRRAVLHFARRMKLFGESFFLLVIAASAAADEVELINGDRIADCKVSDLGDSYKIEKNGISRTVAKTDVKSVEYKETREDVYRKRSTALKNDDVKGHLQLGKWCREIGLSNLAVEEFKKVVAVEPDNEDARAALGFKRHEGRWMTEDEINRANGLVKHKGRWMTPAERDLDIALDERKELERRIAVEVDKLVDRIASSDDKKRQDAIDALAQFEDQCKVKPYLSSVTRSHKQLRLFIVQELGRIKSVLGDSAWTAAKALARRVVWDDSESVRDAAMKSLVTIGHADTCTALAPYVAEESYGARIRAENAIGWFKDLRGMPPLIAALSRVVDTLKFVEQYENQVQQILRNQLLTKDGRRVPIPARLSLGDDAFTKEGKMRLEDERASCIESLKAISGQTFGDEAAKWRDWHEREKAKSEKK